MNNDLCDGCKFRACKRCDTCSRRYADRYEPIPPPRQKSATEVQRLTLALTFMELLDKPIKEATP